LAAGIAIDAGFVDEEVARHILRNRTSAIRHTLILARVVF
jgi:hypothetical protein